MDGYQLLLEFKNGLPYLHCQKPTDDELSSLPHIIMTLDVTWDPIIYDNNYEIIDQFYNPSEGTPVHEYHFDQHGKYWHRTVATHAIIAEEEFIVAVQDATFDDVVDDVMDLLHPESVSVVYNVNLTDVAKVKPNFELLRPLFGWSCIDIIPCTFDVSTQYACRRASDTLK
jgi:hypothetical protein